MAVKRLDAAAVRVSPRLCAIVLAAGAGRRFGGAKLHAPWRGGVLLEAALGSAFAAPVEAVVVVTGGDPAAADTARAFAARRGDEGRLRLAPAGDWAEGLAASLRAGLAAAPPGVDGAFVFLGDMPRIPAGVAERLAAALEDRVDAVQPVHDGAPGHPVLLGRRLFAAAGALTGDRGAQGLLAAPGVRVVRLEVSEPGVVEDVDTPAALARLEGHG